MSYSPIKLDKVRNFRYGMKALHLIEKSLGVSVNNLDLNDLTMEQCATIMWAGLFHEDKDLTPEKVMDLVDEHSSLVEAIQDMSKAFEAAFSGGKGLPKN